MNNLSRPLKVMGIIGIRSGSKGLPNKNIMELMEKPLVGWIIETAKKSKYINRIIVSTDTEEYASIAKKFGAETPFLRPPELSSDFSPEIDFIKNMIDWLEKK